jgi:Ca2+-binding RTX toxin-like protein
MRLVSCKGSGFLEEGIMIQKYITRIIIAMLGILVVLGTVNAIAASNTVSSNHLDELSSAITINNKKPASCTMNLTNIVVCIGGTCNGTNGNDLILGTSGGERINGRGGQDCILGGDGDDDIRGGNAGDVCIGGPGNDTYTGCETCTNGPGLDNVSTCVTVILP